MVKSLFSLLSVTFVALWFMGCQSSPSLSSIQVTPNSATLTYAGQTTQFKAIGTYIHTTHPSFTQDITNQVSWASSSASISTISSSGLATATGVGNTTISATLRSEAGGVVVGSATLVSASGQPAHSLTSITVIPGSGFNGTGLTDQENLYLGEPAQFIAIGNYNTDPLTVDITNNVLWQSSDVEVATINSAGLALANATGSTTMTALGKGSNGADIAGTSNVKVAIRPGGSVLLPMLSVYEVGLGSGTVTSSDGVISCTTSAASGAACTGNYVLGTKVTLTATPADGSTFGGWSANCPPDTATSCSIDHLDNNEPVGAIFNTPN